VACPGGAAEARETGVPRREQGSSSEPPGRRQGASPSGASAPVWWPQACSSNPCLRGEETRSALQKRKASNHPKKATTAGDNKLARPQYASMTPPAPYRGRGTLWGGPGLDRSRVGPVGELSSWCVSSPVQAAVPRMWRGLFCACMAPDMQEEEEKDTLDRVQVREPCPDWPKPCLLIASGLSWSGAPS
jgi:hypothetical protein